MRTRFTRAGTAVLTTLEIVLIVVGYMVVLGVMNWRIACLSLLPIPVWTWYILRFSRQVQPASKGAYRARFSGFSAQGAKAACAALSAKGERCMVLAPS